MDIGSISLIVTNLRKNGMLKIQFGRELTDDLKKERMMSLNNLIIFYLLIKSVKIYLLILLIYKFKYHILFKSLIIYINIV
jgi:hypothetical protein